MKPPLTLDPKPQSVRAARSWIVDGLRSVGRDDLTDAAELGVSELVTNAILHATPPITVRLGGTPAHPRVEVRDSSATPPALNGSMTDDDRLLSTVGRGLGLVSLYSSAWGADVSSTGKVVWFEPTAEPDPAAAQDTGVLDFERLVEDRLAGATPPDEQLTVRLLGMPVQVFAALRGWYVDLRRELRLLALAHGDDYPIAEELTELGMQVEKERRFSHGVEALDQAMRDGADRVDLEYHVPPSAGATMARLRAVLDEADRFCREQRLLSLARTPQQKELADWYLGEFVRQAAGEPAQPWPGGYLLEQARETPADSETADVPQPCGPRTQG